MKKPAIFLLAALAAFFAVSCFSPYMASGGVTITFGENSSRAYFDFSSENIARLTHSVIVRSGADIALFRSGIKSGLTVDLPLNPGTYDIEVTAFDGETPVARGTEPGVRVRDGAYTDVILLLYPLPLDGNTGTGGEEENPVGEIIITTSITTPGKFFAIAGEGEVTIDWGGGIEPLTCDIAELEDEITMPTHELLKQIPYSNTQSGTKRVVIKGAVTALSTGDTGAVSALDTSRMKGLEMLHCRNEKLTTLDIKGNPALVTLDCSKNQLTSLDVTRNAALKTLVCATNPLTSLLVRGAAALETLNCEFTELTTLNLSQTQPDQNPIQYKWGALHTLTFDTAKITELDISYNKFTSFELAGNPVLTKLICANNLLRTLSLQNLSALTELNCASNELTSLDVSEPRLLARLNCAGNQIKTFTANGTSGTRHALSQLTWEGNPLENVSITYTQISILNVSDFRDLATLDCSNNQLISLTLSNNPALAYLNCASNNLSGTALSNVITRLPNRISNSSGELYLSGNSTNILELTPLVATAAAIGWTVKDAN